MNIKTEGEGGDNEVNSYCDFLSFYTYFGRQSAAILEELHRIYPEGSGSQINCRIGGCLPVIL